MNVKLSMKTHLTLPSCCSSYPVGFSSQPHSAKSPGFPVSRDRSVGSERQHVLWTALSRYQSMAMSSGHLPPSFIPAVQKGSSKGVHDGSVWWWSSGCSLLVSRGRQAEEGRISSGETVSFLASASWDFKTLIIY